MQSLQVTDRYFTVLDANNLRNHTLYTATYVVHFA